MVDELQTYKLKKIFGEIVCTFSIYKYGNLDVYIKHLSPLDDLRLSYKYQSCYDILQKRGVFTSQDKLNYLISNDLWSIGNEKKIENSQKILTDLYNDKRKIFSFKDKEFYANQIKNEEQFLGDLLNKKSNLIGETCENLAQRETDLFLIQNTIFKNSDLKYSLFSPEQFEEISIEETDELFKIYRKFQNDFDDLNIKKLAINYIFTRIFFLAENVIDFFGGAVSKLSHNQTKLITFGGQFKSIFESNPGMPSEILDDPEKIEDWYFGKKNIEKILENNTNEDGVVSIVGLSQKELKYYHLDNPVKHEDKLVEKLKNSPNRELSLEESVNLGLI